MRSILVVLALLATTGTGWADIVGTWKTGNGETLTVSYRDKNHIRMDAGAEGYMLVSGDKVYLVSQSDGKWMAMDMDEMAGMMKLFGQKPPHTTGESAGETRFEPTGRKETIAGYEGIICGLSAMYTGLAQVLNETYGWVFWPVGVPTEKAVRPLKLAAVEKVAQPSREAAATKSA